jgi:hypothetical protein
VVRPDGVLDLEIPEHLPGSVTVPTNRSFMLKRGTLRPLADSLEVLFVTYRHNSVGFSLNVADHLCYTSNGSLIMVRNLEIRYYKYPMHLLLLHH